jgi:cell division protein FtsL
MTQIRSWLKDNATLATFLVAQAVAIAFGIVSLIVYATKLETRVHIMETRGSAYTVESIGKLEEHIGKIEGRLTTLEEQVHSNSESIKRIVDIMTRELNKQGAKQ